MPQGSKKSYTGKQKRKAEHIEDSEKEKGASKKTAERIAWATVNKQDGGGKKSGTGSSKTTKAKSKSTQAKSKSTRAGSKTTKSKTSAAKH